MLPAGNEARWMFFRYGVEIMTPSNVSVPVALMCRTRRMRRGPPLRLGFQKKRLHVLDAVLGRHRQDVVQGVHVAQHLHDLFDLVPVGRNES
ncbi:hypothetical protein EYF80_041120 [Liparis tanakae]|uniref:Uncharacterized protein n=1 Tax=Liparis tanakae TaxID=230148 RepID=A0A4Z2G6X2_9TELE|nr:hypothetical protein EYF80_041120 [Liparis tanakae]